MVSFLYPSRSTHALRKCRRKVAISQKSINNTTLGHSQKVQIPVHVKHRLCENAPALPIRGLRVKNHFFEQAACNTHFKTLPLPRQLGAAGEKLLSRRGERLYSNTQRSFAQPYNETRAQSQSIVFLYVVFVLFSYDMIAIFMFDILNKTKHGGFPHPVAPPQCTGYSPKS